MSEDDIFAEVGSVFGTAIGQDPDFLFVFLQRCGPGSNTLTAPSVSSSFSWAAKEVVHLAGQGCLYVRAESDLEIFQPRAEREVRCLSKI